jgi:hypothetical protein
MHPTMALEIAQPVCTDVNVKYTVKLPMAPEITAVSYPNNNPPSAALMAINRIYLLTSLSIVSKFF